MKKVIFWLPMKFFHWRDRRWKKHYSEYSKEELIEEVIWERHEKITYKVAIVTIAAAVLIAKGLIF